MTFTDYSRLRQILKEKRKALTIPKRQQDSDTLCAKALPIIQQHSSSQEWIAAFWPIGDEIDIRPLLIALDKLGYRIGLPSIKEKDSPLTFFAWSPTTEFKTGFFNIPEPNQSALLTDAPGLILTPVLGFTKTKDRLGYGKGYYDRTIALWRQQGYSPFCIGIAWDEGLIDDKDYQAAPHDQELDMVLTPSFMFT